MDDGWADGARYGGEHGKHRSLHEILLRRRAGVYRLGIEMERGATGMAIGRRIGAGFLASALFFSGSVAAAGNTADEKKAVAVDEIFVMSTKISSTATAFFSSAVFPAAATEPLKKSALARNPAPILRPIAIPVAPRSISMPSLYTPARRLNNISCKLLCLPC